MTSNRAHINPLLALNQRGQSVWLDNISREMLDSGQLQRYIDEYSVTGLTSNPSIFDKAIASGAYDDEIRRKAAAEDPEELFFALAFEDLGRAADLFEPIHRRTSGVDGWVSLEVSPLLADDASRTVQAAADLHARAGRENVFIKIPGTRAGWRRSSERWLRCLSAGLRADEWQRSARRLKEEDLPPSNRRKSSGSRVEWCSAHDS